MSDSTVSMYTMAFPVGRQQASVPYALLSNVEDDDDDDDDMLS